jgi:hemerythrin-like domain-containing protein
MDFLNPLDFIVKEHDQHQVLCDLLEEIADGLPDDVDRKKALKAAEALKFELPLHHRIEEEALFPMLIKYAVAEDNLDEIVNRLNEEHVVDESFADELIDFLEDLARGKSPNDANMFGYMLRGFFENYRRHIMWENSIVIPLARRRISVEGLQELASHMAKLQADPTSQIDLSQEADSISAAISTCNGKCEDCRSKPDNSQS